MCGLAGVFNLDGRPVIERHVVAMTDRMSHRGPDGDGYHIDHDFGVGHRRLAIIDLTEAASQPMTSSDGRYVLSYNGEVYNYRELRKDLEQVGARFRSEGDTEVVLNALQVWGLEALDRFNGMFALALWDSERRSLLLARDRYGVKPLYTARLGDSFLFGSEVKALLAHPDLTARLDADGLAEYLTFQNLFTERTLFEGVSLFPAGSWQRISQTSTSGPNSWWDFSFEPDITSSEDELMEELDRLFTAAVDRQLVSDVGVNSYLSGGVDSGAITVVASSLVPEMKTFTVGFDMAASGEHEQTFDERDNAEQLARLVQTQHYEFVLKPSDVERAMARLVWHLEEPRMGQSYPNYYAAKLAAGLGKVVLSGTGGDELFAGYPWRSYRSAASRSFDDYLDRTVDYWHRLGDPQERSALLQPLAGVTEVDPREIISGLIPRPMQSLGADGYVNSSLYLEAKTFFHGLLIVEDKLSMSHGLETRVPFLDNELVDFATRIPAHLKLGNLETNNGGSPVDEKYSDGKLILRRMLERYVPAEIAGRPKQGFSAPDASWFRTELSEFVRRRLLDRNSPLFDYVDRATVRARVEEHLDGKVNRRLLIWSLTYLDQWMRIFRI